MVTEVPTPPEVGDRLVMLGAVETVKLTPLLATPPTVTTTLPVVAPVGTGATIEVALQLVGVAAVVGDPRHGVEDDGLPSVVVQGPAAEHLVVLQQVVAGC